MYLKIKNAKISHLIQLSWKSYMWVTLFSFKHVKFKISKKTMKLQNNHHSCEEKLTDKNVSAWWLEDLFITIQGLPGNK